MTFHFLDTSALVKLYINEKGAAKVGAIRAKSQIDPGSVRLVVSRIAFPEAVSAITRRRNSGKISAMKASHLRHDLFAHFTSPKLGYEFIEASAAVVNQAALLVTQYGLRGFDAVHLASAIFLQQHLQATERLVFVSADKALTRAARAEKLVTIDPTT